ncbi:TraU family protein [Cereibacter sphaeroides]|uniref:TraU family protein n=1 Tax=Cereibacter sphaeroides TaxID=1063 RepID=UPI000DECBB59|nr:TraU family protein [Cereibacter sphaeroides]AXC64197.1 hypothetical protein DQL45_22860 [Cereibacter sphaeroides 2.4.1]
MKGLFFAMALALGIGASGASFAKCNAKFLNPITEVCWDCIFPISIGSIKVLNKRPDTKKPVAARSVSARARRRVSAWPSGSGSLPG